MLSKVNLRTFILSKNSFKMYWIQLQVNSNYKPAKLQQLLSWQSYSLVSCQFCHFLLLATSSCSWIIYLFSLCLFCTMSMRIILSLGLSSYIYELCSIQFVHSVWLWIPLAKNMNCLGCWCSWRCTKYSCLRSYNKSILVW